MNAMPHQKIRAAIYTRKSREEGLEQEFNSLDAQHEARWAGAPLLLLQQIDHQRGRSHGLAHKGRYFRNSFISHAQNLSDRDLSELTAEG